MLRIRKRFWFLLSISMVFAFLSSYLANDISLYFGALGLPTAVFLGLEFYALYLLPRSPRKAEGIYRLLGVNDY